MSPYFRVSSPLFPGMGPVTVTLVLLVAGLDESTYSCVLTVSVYFGLRSCTLEFELKYLLALLTWLLSYGVVPGRAQKVIVDVFLRPFFSKATWSKV